MRTIPVKSKPIKNGNKQNDTINKSSNTGRQNLIYVEECPYGIPSPKAERAAELNIRVITAHSKVEKLLIKLLTGARDLTELPNDSLDGEGVTVKPEGKFAVLLKNAEKVLGLMTGPNVSIKPSKNSGGGHYSILPRNQPGNEHTLSNHNNKGRIDSKENNTADKNSSSEFERPRYIIRRRSRDQITVNGIRLALCKMNRSDINALANPGTKEIFINVNSTVIQKIITQDPLVQQVLLMEEISHELSHILGYGLLLHDIQFFKTQRLLKYIAVQAM